MTHWFDIGIGSKSGLLDLFKTEKVNVTLIVEGKDHLGRRVRQKLEDNFNNRNKDFSKLQSRIKPAVHKKGL